MKYAQHRSSLGMNGDKPQLSSGDGFLGFWVVGFIVVVVIILVVIGKNPKTLPDRQAGEIQTQDQTEAEIQTSTEAQTSENTAIEEIDLIAIDGYQGSAIARRGKTGELFSHVIVAELPQIDLSTQFYEGWLVKPGVIKFFSTGEMFPRTDGKWGLVFEVEASGQYLDIEDYAKVVITLEKRDGDPAPSANHLLEGLF